MKKTVQIKPDELNRPDWLQIWAGKWSLFSCSHFAVEYVSLIRFRGRPFLPETVIVVKNGKSQGWARQRDREEFCHYLADEVNRNPKRVIQICNNLKKQSDHIRKFLRTHSRSIFTAKIFEEYFQKLVAYYQPHINVKYIVDGLSENQIKRYFVLLEKARVYAETVLTETEEFLENMAKQIGKKEKLPQSLVLCCTYQEIEDYLNGKPLPSKLILQKRNPGFAVFANTNKNIHFIGRQFKQVEAILNKVQSFEVLHGTVAQRGKIVGHVRIVHDPKNITSFTKGDILVASMTRPEYLPLMKKAGGFITDSGGLLSHAAITARELKKPCIVGTKVATKVFRDGVLVEVDANKGIVRKL
ncbi:MAG: PEP-utilizing enzyme [Patescibacteria group bacterium]|jgi:phosphohistidine swiveling domain-containing protein